MTRVIKLQANYVPKNDYRKTFAIRPKLTLSGKWMEEAGFLPSTLINVEVQFGKLVITSKE
jgi:hypothetical protein